MNQHSKILARARQIPDRDEQIDFVKNECRDEPELCARILAELNLDTISSSDSASVEIDSDFSEAGLAQTQILSSENTASRNTDGSDDALPFLLPSNHADSLGRIGHYEVRRVLGRGAFGIVLEAFDEKLHRVVALKMLSPELSVSSPARKRFLREARASAAVRHENVVSIYSVEELPIPYLVMEYIAGRTLQQRIDDQGPLEVLEVLSIGRQVAAGMAAAHAVNLIHRDIKPSNILLEGDLHPRVHITDFGLARAADDASITSSGLLAGTPLYMSPEQARGETLDHRSDLFSLGSVLYHVISGRPPFRAANTVAVLKRVCEHTPRSLQETIPETPQWFSTIIERLLEKKPEDRFQTAQEVAELLAACESELKRTGKVRSVTLRTQSWVDANQARPAKSGRLLKMATAAAAIVLAVSFVFLALRKPLSASKVASDSLNTQEASERPSESPQASNQLAVGQSSNLQPTAASDLERPEATNLQSLKNRLTPGDYALRFDHDGDLVRIPTTYDGSHPITLEAVIQIDERAGDESGTIITVGHVTLERTFRSTIGIGVSPGGKYVGVEKKNLAYKQSYHVAGVWNEKMLRVFVDGKLSNETAVDRSLENYLGEYFIGGRIDRFGNYFAVLRGVIDEVRISNVARYTDDYEPVNRFEPDEHTIALYHFDEGQGDIVKDSSGNGHDGKIF
ncbi:MAG: protein kinase, partial [Pirellulaceae bacterium]